MASNVEGGDEQPPDGDDGTEFITGGNTEEEENEAEEAEFDPCLAFNLEEEEDGEGEEEEEGHHAEETAKEILPFCTEIERKPVKVKKVKPWYLKQKKGDMEKRQNSSIAFVMPRQEDPEAFALKKTNKVVHKLIKYMKKSWKIRMDRKQCDRELEHRTLASVYTMKPPDWMQKIKNRESRALETGFFSAMDIPYDPLIDLELDTALLTFKNLPPDLKITAGRWIRDRLRKEELKRKRDAFLPRLPHGKTKRPSYSKGRLIKDPGGAKKVDQFVKTAEGFVRLTKGNTPYTKVLDAWSKKKEKEGYSSNSGFGVVKEGTFDFRGKGRISDNTEEADDDFGGSSSDQRRVSIVDARKYQRDMLHFEKMLGAMYDIVKSMLNIKVKQLECKFPLPPSAVLQARARSPDRALCRHKGTPLLVLQRNAMRMRKSGASLADVRSVLDIASNRRLSDDPNSNPQPMLSHGKVLSERGPTGVNARKSLTELGQKMNREQESKQRLSIAGGSLQVKDVVHTSPPRSSKAVIGEIKKQHSFDDLLDIRSRRNVLLTAEQKIKRLAENPEHAAIRRARNFMTYTKLFEKGRRVKRPIWHHIDISQIASEFSNSKLLTAKDATNLTEADAAEVVDLAMKKRKTMSKRNEAAGDEVVVHRRWPEEHEIVTPTFQFPEERIKIPSEEQSRLELLKKIPHIDEIPPTPVRRLFKLAGVRTTEKDIFNNIMEMKKLFRLTEKKIRVYYENEVGKLDWDTVKRFHGKFGGLKPKPVYQWTINAMRQNDERENINSMLNEGEDNDEDDTQKKMMQKRPALWFKKLHEECEMNGALRHNGCQTEIQKLLKYCDVDMKTKPHMLNRLALLVVSLPTTELGTKYWQQAVVFLLEHMFGTPAEMIHVWLKYRGLPYLL